MNGERRSLVAEESLLMQSEGQFVKAMKPRATCDGDPVFGEGKTSVMPSVVRFVGYDKLRLRINNPEAGQLSRIGLWLPYQYSWLTMKRLTESKCAEPCSTKVSRFLKQVPTTRPLASLNPIEILSSF